MVLGGVRASHDLFFDKTIKIWQKYNQLLQNYDTNAFVPSFSYKIMLIALLIWIRVNYFL